MATPMIDGKYGLSSALPPTRILRGRLRPHAYWGARQNGALSLSNPFCITYMHYAIASVRHRLTAGSDGGKSETCVKRSIRVSRATWKPSCISPFDQAFIWKSTMLL